MQSKMYLHTSFPECCSSSFTNPGFQTMVRLATTISRQGILTPFDPGNTVCSSCCFLFPLQVRGCARLRSARGKHMWQYFSTLVRHVEYPTYATTGWVMGSRPWRFPQKVKSALFLEKFATLQCTFLKKTSL